jgi:hypothetical protein
MTSAFELVDKNKVLRTIRDAAHRFEPVDAETASAALIHVLAGALKSHVSRLSKFHCEAVGAEVAPELLAEQNLHIGLIINHENKEIHARSPDLIRDAPMRGRTILSSVNSPGRVGPPQIVICALMTSYAGKLLGDPTFRPVRSIAARP